MSGNQLYCPDETRKALVKAQESPLNGIDYLEVLDNDAPAGSPRQRTLLVHCLKDLGDLDRDNVLIEGGVRVSPVGVVWAHRADAVPAELLNDAEKDYLKPPPDGKLPDPAKVLVVRTDRSGDFSIYTLRLILSPAEPDDPSANFDSQLSAVAFTFKVDCPSDFDCKTDLDCPEPVLPAPQIDYLAKDYASFRRLMLDRLAIVMPNWTERNPADVGIALVEVLACAADQLSYYQDAVATEAYLGTARRRTSVRRHARLVDYFMHDGANARTWVAIEVGGSNVILPSGTPLLGRESDASTVVPPAELTRALSTGPAVFETLHDLRLREQCNEIHFYTWGDPDCCLPRGATRANLEGSAADLDLREGDVLIIEEVLGAESGRQEDVDPSHRRAVRLNAAPVARTDPYNGTPVLEVSWHADDALPFPLCLRQFPDRSGTIRHVSVARGNVVLADYGLTIKDEDLFPPEVPVSGRYRPRLRRDGLTHAMPYDDETARQEPAATALKVDLRRVAPEVVLHGELQAWTPQRDLLNSDRFAPEFVVEMESDGRAYLRFGDDVLGRQPSPRSGFTATYRVGNGTAGNVGAEALGQIVTTISGIRSVRNPLPAVGGTDPELLEQVRLYAPEAFRVQQRAVTEADWTEVAQRHPEVQRAAASRRWTGSWHTWFVTVDRKGGRPVDAAFETDLRAFLGRFRLAGYDLEIDAPCFVPLDIALTVCVTPGYFRGNVEQALLETFSTRDLPDGRRGFFHPDNFTFGQPVYLSQITAAAMTIQGVDWVKPFRFQRWGEDPHGELDNGVISFARLEIARLDNDPNQPENGKIEFDMQGGA